MASRRPSAERTLSDQQHESLNQYGDCNNMGPAPTSAEFGFATLLDNWEYNLDNGGFMFDDNMSSQFPTYMFSSTY